MKTCIINLRFAKKTLVALAAMFLFLAASAETLKAQPCVTNQYTPDYCQSPPPPQHGLFWCVSTVFADSVGCEPKCIESIYCHHIHFRYVPGDPSCPTIDKIEIGLNRDSNSTEYQVCMPVSQWGKDGWVEEWSVMDSIHGAITTGDCNDWLAGYRTRLTFDPPSNPPQIPPAPLGATYELQDLNHWQVTICGVKSYNIKITYSDNSTYSFVPSVINLQCPPACP